MINLLSPAVRAQREPGSRDAIDYFPTPPWATRAFIAEILSADRDLDCRTIWEPAAGGGHMVAPLAETGALVVGSDLNRQVWPSPLFERPNVLQLDGAPNFLTDDVFDRMRRPDWIITNPPFNLAIEFVERSLALAQMGVAMLLRTSWLEGADRFERLFAKTPPTIIAQYAERVPMTKGRWDPDASTATAYAWFIWKRGWSPQPMRWIPPGQKARFHRQADIELFCPPANAPLLSAGGLS